MGWFADCGSVTTVRVAVLDGDGARWADADTGLDITGDGPDCWRPLGEHS